jgi:O-antigen/teichoic acid export membrane protein
VRSADPPAASFGRLRRHLPSWGREWAADSSFLLLSNIVTMLLTTTLAILIARNLDPEDWGAFSGFLALGLAVSIVVDFGLGTWLLREFS